MDVSCTSFEREHIKHAILKCQIRKRNTCNGRGNVDGWRCQTCGRILLYKVVNHQKSQERQTVNTDFFTGTDNVTCIICNEVFKSISGLKRHTVVYKHQLPRADPIDLERMTPFLCHICIKFCGSVTELLIVLKGHERKGADSGVVRLWGTAVIC